MKTFFKKNLIWVFALVLGIGTMSFKIVEKKSDNGASVEWYYTEDVSDFEYDQTKYIEYDGQSCPGAMSVRCSLTAPREANGYPQLSSATNITYKN